MRRGPLLGIIVLVLLIGGYCGYWFIAAGRIEEGIGAWAQSLPRENAELTWRTIRVGGFPFAFDVRLGEARLRAAKAPGAELSAPVFSATARPWNPYDWQLSAPQGLNGTVGSGQETVKIAAPNATGAVAATGNDFAIWFRLDEPVANLPERVTADTADFWVILPGRAPQEHTERALGLAADLRRLDVSFAPAPFKGAIDQLGFGATVLGPIPTGPPRQAATAWRDSGGTVELDRFALRWGSVGMHGSGTLALGPDLQPIGAFSGGVSGLDQLIAGLAQAGQLRIGDMTIARLGLAALAKPGPDGKPEVSTSFTIQNGQMYLGPLKLGPVPRINW